MAGTASAGRDSGGKPTVNVDSLRWLESDDEAVRAWTIEQNDRAQASLAGLSGIQWCRTALVHGSAAGPMASFGATVDVPVAAGDRWFRRGMNLETGRDTIYSSVGLGGEERLVADPAAMLDRRRWTPTSVESLAPGRLLIRLLEGEGAPGSPALESVPRPAVVAAAVVFASGTVAAELVAADGSRWHALCVVDDRQKAAVQTVVRAWGTASRGWQLHGIAPSPSGRLVAGMLSGGTSAHPLMGPVAIIDADSGRVVDVVDEAGPLGMVAWAPSDAGVWVNRPDCRSGGGGLVLHRLDGTEDWAPPLPEAFPYVQPVLSHDGHWLIAATGLSRRRAAFVCDLQGDRRWRPLLDDEERSSLGIVVGDEYLAVSYDQAPTGRVLAVSLADSPQPDGTREVIAESDAVMHSIALIGSHLAVTVLH